MSQKEHVLKLQFFVAVIPFLIASLLALFTWRTPSIIEFIIIAAAGFIGTLGQLGYVNAVKLAEASYVAPFGYIRILIAFPIGYFCFGESVGFTDLFGATLIIITTYYFIKSEPSKTSLSTS